MNLALYMGGARQAASKGNQVLEKGNSTQNYNFFSFFTVGKIFPSVNKWQDSLLKNIQVKPRPWQSNLKIVRGKNFKKNHISEENAMKYSTTWRMQSWGWQKLKRQSLFLDVTKNYMTPTCEKWISSSGQDLVLVVFPELGSSQQTW